jgi:diguanylate cyclase (GGDEF)-like protein
MSFLSAPPNAPSQRYNTLAMKPILQNLVEMTGHRDYLRLEVSVLSTLQQLSGILEARALEVFLLNGLRYTRPRTWMQDGQWTSTESEAAADSQRQLLDQLPDLQHCIQERNPYVCTAIGKNRYTLWLPVWMHDQVSTCLEVTQSRPFSAHRLEVLTAIFNVYQNYQSLLDYSERDALTGLFNRKTFDDQFARHASIESGIPDDERQQWLAVIDIDHFKQVNDRFGHLYGDEVLILMANILRNSFRSHDRIFRFGGEEFVVLLRSTSLATAHKVFNRFRQTVEEYSFPQVGRITASVGFVSTAANTPVEILGQADQALYFAKENGRNQVRFYDDLVASGDLQARISNEDIELF